MACGCEWQVVVHVHAAREAAIVSKLVSLLDPKTGQVTKRQPRALPSNSSAVVEVSGGMCWADLLGGMLFHVSMGLWCFLRYHRAFAERTMERHARCSLPAPCLTTGDSGAASLP